MKLNTLKTVKKYMARLVPLGMIILLCSPYIVQAMSAEQKSLYKQGIGYYDLCDEGANASTGVSNGTGKADGAAFPDLDPTAMANAIDAYIKEVNPNSQMKDLGAVIVASADNANVSPFLVVAIAQKESSLSSASDYNVSNANNSFGRTATTSQPNHYSASVNRYWYKWSSVKASVDFTATENKSASGGGDIMSYIREQYGSKVDKDDLVALMMEYAPPAENDTAKYISDVKSWVDKMVSLTEGGVSGSSTVEPTAVASSCSCTPSSDSTVVAGADNIETAYKFFINLGLSPEQAAGAVGNLQQESGLSPKADNGSHRGIAQWDYAGRFAKLKGFAKDHNKDPDELETQLLYIKYELEGGYKKAYKELKKQTTVAGAATIWDSLYEISGGSAMDQRIAYGDKILEKYGDSVAGSTVNSQSSCSDSGGGQSGQFIDGFKIYSQTDPAWTNKAFGSSTIGISGCGPSAMAMIITALNGSSVTPVDTATYAASKGIYVPGSGSSWNLAPVVAAKWNLKSKSLSVSQDSINQTLKDGGLVIAVGRGPKPFTSGGHFIVIRAVTDDGKWMVGDSAHADANTKSWDPEQLLTSIRNNNGGSVYGITK